MKCDMADNRAGQSFNMVTQQDSRVILTHSEVMKGIAAVTIFFLPATTIAVSLSPSPIILSFAFTSPSFLSSSSFFSSFFFLHHQLNKTDNLWLPILLKQPAKQQAASLAGFLDVLGLGHPNECRRFPALFPLAICLAWAEK